MELVKIAEQNKTYFSEDFIKGFDTGVSRQYQHDIAEKTGKWIDNETSYADGVEQTCTCSICGRRSERPLGDYCRWCGARMVEE